MKRTSILFICILISVVLAACDAGDGAALPTLLPTSDSQTVADTPVPDAASDEAALAETPTPEEPAATPTSRPTRRALPPTQTQTPTSEPTSTPTEIIPTATFFNPPMVIDPGCEGFEVDFANSDLEFPLGTAPTISWTAIPGATQYSVTLEDINQRVILDGIFVAETTYTFPADAFERGELYGWKVFPLDADIEQLCFHTGQELIPRVSAPGQ
ncbi:MAG: hypothetical protein ACPG7F_04240 [Aggregatilineales bacterium]